MSIHIPCTHEACDAEYSYEFEIVAEKPTRWYPGTPPQVQIIEADYEGDVPPCGHEQDWDRVDAWIWDRLRWEELKR